MYSMFLAHSFISTATNGPDELDELILIWG